MLANAKYHVKILFTNMLVYSSPSSIIYLIVILVETIQMMSFPYDYYDFLKESNEVGKVFAGFSTYLRVLSLVILAPHLHQNP